MNPTISSSTAGSEKSLALVTGAAGGIGQGLVAALVSAGWDVAANDLIDADTFSPALDAHRQPGSRIEAITADVGDESAVDRLYREIIDRFERLPDLLVNNAGVQTWKPLVELEFDEWQRTITTNLSGCFLNIRCYARHLIGADQAGVIVNIGSGCNTLAFPNLVDYAASKGGIEMLTKSAALELGPHRIRVNCVAPGATETDRTKAETADYAGAWSAITPLGRLGQPADVAGAVLLLASPQASFITGQTLAVDGGVFSRAMWPAGY